ncbi:hypothetical protein K239x_19090 [Planctomycetes bacterium K23_9]|uniref:Planctomycete cytochrome C n=2 Tax=Stieleria marina TaxID=1930275 RepID=A0A517NS91_9BACT|nr:hypothetical protein K239x_19090 [Planctomycetes bacterium K23_9]
MACRGSGYDQDMKPLLSQYCSECHSGEHANGDVDFDDFAASGSNIDDAFELWESVAGHLENRTMPPGDSPQPSDEERRRALMWYQTFVESVQMRPAVMRPRRLSVIEYRNTLRSVLGFDLQTAVIEAEQTDSERSLVVKLLPTDPPGASGFTNDTHANPITMIAWEQYAYLANVGLEALFSQSRRSDLEVLAGPIDSGVGLTLENAREVIRRFVPKAYRRTVSDAAIEKIVARLDKEDDKEIADKLRFEMKAVLMSPAFLYRGFLAEGERGQSVDVDDFELAERLSYFLWADMPDQTLVAKAEARTLSDPKTLAGEVDRMLASPKARSLSEVFVSQWFTLSEIDLASDNPPIRDALKSQPMDFMHFLLTNDRPLMEMVDSDISFINLHTARMYGKDAKQLNKHVKQKGIESEVVPNQQIRLEHSTERGGVLTMPGILAMNRGPILRGTWILERILGQHLPDPPANVGQVAENRRGESLTFRERFEQHRSSDACSVCHDKIDPLGFSLQTFDDRGQYLLAENYQSKSKGKSKGTLVSVQEIDASGQLPTGERFQDVGGLKQILVTSQRKAVIRNIVRQALAYALCRKLELFDRPTVESITQTMADDNGTWRDLIHAITHSVPFRKAIFSERDQ